MNKVLKVMIIVFCVLVVSGISYATYKAIEKKKIRAEITPTFTSGLSNVDTNKVWIGTFNLVWNDFMNDVIGGPIEFEDGYSELANELNKQSFTSNQLSKNSYYKIHGQASFDLKSKIENGIKEKFNEESSILDRVNWGNSNSYLLYCMLKKEFHYLEEFPTLYAKSFGDSEEKVEYFGIEPSTGKSASKNVEILFYNNEDDFAVKLKTKEGEEVYLYRTTGEGKSFEGNYDKMLEKQSKYEGNKEFQEDDILRIPYIKLKEEINYDELCGRWIKGENIYIEQAMQTVDFELNNYGGSVKSEALLGGTLGGGFVERLFVFNDTFLLYLKEENKEKPYFALKVDDVNVLEISDV